MPTTDDNDVLDGWGARLAAARSAANLTQAALASALDVKVFTIQRWEAGSRRPSEEDQRRIAGAVGAHVTALFPRTDRETELEELVAEADHILAQVGGGCS